jgi:polysaccharide pyruvyl transferase WcaK-like protein
MKRETIGLLGPYGYGNLGDAAIQDAMLANVRRWRPGARLVGLSLNPTDTTERHAIPAYPLYPKCAGGKSSSAGGTPAPAPFSPQALTVKARVKDLMRSQPVIGWVLTPALALRRWIERAGQEASFSFQAWRRLRDFELLVISGGGQLDDSWGGPWRHPFTLFRWTLLARLAGARVVFLSIGAGPLNARLSRGFCCAALALADYTSYRDAESATFVREHLGRGDERVVPDLAFSLGACPPSDAAADARYAAVGPMPYFDPRSWPDKDAATYADYLERMCAIVAGLIDRDYPVVLFGSDIHMDERVIRDLLDRIADRAPAAASRVRYQPTPTVPALMSLLQGAEFVVASRYHGVLLSHLLATPAIAISYHPKVTSLMKDAGQSEYCLDLAVATAPDVLTCTDRLLGSLIRVRGELRARSDAFRARLETQYAEVFGAAREAVGRPQPMRTESAAPRGSVREAV